MATRIYEFFGHRAHDKSAAAVDAADHRYCPFLDDTCVKTLNDGTVAGVCTLQPVTSEPVICCPIRLYADDYRILVDVADLAFGGGFPLVPGATARREARHLSHPVVAVFGRRWGGELRLPQRKGLGSYFVDWILALINPDGSLGEFVAVEVQSIDTTGNYRDARSALLDQSRRVVPATAGFNWENVSKRILPQLLYKGNVLQREASCRKGLFFVTPTPIHDRIFDRLGGKQNLLTYPLQSSSITFVSYGLDHSTPVPSGSIVPLVQQNVYTTNIGQVAQAFAGPGVMPPINVYQQAIEAAL